MARPKKYKTDEERKAAQIEVIRRWRAAHPDYQTEYYKNNRERIAEQQAEYYQNNKEKIAEYYQDNKEKKLEYQTEYYKNNKEKIAEYWAEYRQNNKEKFAEYYQNNKEKFAEYYQNNKEKIAEYQAEYRQINKEKIAEYQAEYRSTQNGRAIHLISCYQRNDKKYNRGECTLTADWIVKHIFSQPCHYCSKTDWTKMGCDRIDNTLPHTPDNVVPCCCECNRKKARYSYDEFMRMIGKVV